MNEAFIKLKQDLLTCEAFDLYQKVIIAKISSWQRNKKQFFESHEELARQFKCDRKTVARRMDELEAMGVIYKDGKVKRSWIYKVSTMKLNMYLTGTYLERNVPQSPVSSKICTTDDHYKNNNKNINKNIFRKEEDDLSSSSSSKPEIDLEDLIQEINREI